MSSRLRPLRIGYSCHDAFPSTDTNTHQIFWTVSEVARLGVDVRLMVPALTVGGPNLRQAVAAYFAAPAGAMPASFSIDAGERPPRGAVDHARFDWSVPARSTGAGFDLIWTRDPLAVAACVRAGLPTVFETFRPDFATRPVFAPWRRLCLRSPHLAGVVLHSQLAADAYTTAGVEASRCLVARNGFSPEMMEPELEPVAARARLGLPADRPLVVYAGHVVPGKGIEDLVEIAAAVPQADFLILGVEAGAAAWIESAARAARTRNLILRPLVPPGAVAPYLYAADCLIIPPYDDPARRHRRGMLPMKVFAYLAAGRAIVAPRTPDLEEVLADGRTACLVPPCDATAAASAVARLLDDAPTRERLGRNARTESVQYTWAARARTLVAFFDRVAVQAAPRSATAAAASSRV